MRDVKEAAYSQIGEKGKCKKCKKHLCKYDKLLEIWNIKKNKNLSVCSKTFWAVV